MCLQIVFLHSSIHSYHVISGDGGSAIGCVIDRKIPANAYLAMKYGEYPVTEIIQELKRNCMVGVAKGRAEFG